MMESPSPDVILLVEDDIADEELAIRELRANRVANAIVVRRDGAAALDYLFGGRALPMVTILDLRLPIVDGIEILRKVRGDARTKDLPVIVLTGSHEDVDAMQTYALQASRFFQKPLTWARFEAAMTKLGLAERLQFGSTPANAPR
jgi:CheY-like chemotaxis protein